MFSIPSHKQTDPSKLPAQRINPVRLADYIEMIDPKTGDDKRLPAPSLKAALERLIVDADNHRRACRMVELDIRLRAHLQGTRVRLDHGITEARRALAAEAAKQEESDRRN